MREEPHVCPECGSTRLSVDDRNPSLLLCDDCGAQHFVNESALEENAAAEASDSSNDDSNEPDAREDELDGLRIARMVKLKRAAYRTRSFLIIGAIASLVLILQLAAMTGREYAAARWSRRAILYVAIAAMCLLAVGWCVRRIHEVNADLRGQKEPRTK